MTAMTASRPTALVRATLTSRAMVVDLPTSTTPAVRVSMSFISSGLTVSTDWRHCCWSGGSRTKPEASAALGRVSDCSTVALVCHAALLISAW